MANRHLLRSVVLQSLFEWDFREVDNNLIGDIVVRNAEEFAPGMSDFSFAKKLADGVVKKKADLDMIIGKAAPEWPIDKIANVDRNVLRLGLYELIFADRKEVPAKVAINESIELAKSFGGETSGKFVNGVLGAVYKELGEPGKDDVKTPKKNKDIPYEEMPIKTLAGGVVYAKHDGEIYLALVHDVFGHWTLSKGGIDMSKDIKIAAAEKIEEEIGVKVEIKDELASNEYVASHPEEGKIRKQVVYFLAEANYEPLKLEEGKCGLDNVKWFNVKEILTLNFYNDIMPIIVKALGKLSGKTTEATAEKTSNGVAEAEVKTAKVVN